jgi:predicted ATPase/DNA-binding CsgD family transcriptional regulator/DNA-binding XRE family transcriptional regulator
METEPSFGAWIRRRRKLLDLLQKELASRIGCSVTALQKIERDERRPSRQLAERLSDALSVPAEQRATFLQVARGERITERLDAQPIAPAEATARPPVSPRRTLASPPTPLIGREAELTQIAQLLHDPQCRLLTLTGPGGIGKTRLAIAAAEQGGAFAHGIAFATLAPIMGREQMITAIADALGCVLYSATDRAEQLIHYLRDKALLLILDNFEHLLAEPTCVALVSDLVHGADELTLLVTSREPLNIQVEWVFDVQGLPMPASAGAGDIQASSAARLFQQRARQARVGYSLTSEDHPAVVSICQLVGGLPLGIELAAAWVRTLSCQEIAHEIQRNVDFLATRAYDVSERHRSIRAVFEHSWALLTAEEQSVLRQLSVFRGGFWRTAAEEIAGASLTILAALVTKSLLRRTATGRYDLHDLVRQYALGYLQQNDQEEIQTRSRHSRYYARLLEQQGPAFKGPDQVAVSAALMSELANLRQAWDWAATHRLAPELSQAADPLFWLYEAQSNFREGVPLFGQAVQSLQAVVEVPAASDEESARQLALGQTLSYQGFFCFRQGQYSLSRELLQESLDLLGPLADAGKPAAGAARANAIAFLGIVTYRMGEYAQGHDLLHEALINKRRLGDQWGVTLCLRQLGLAAHAQGEYDEAYRLLRESVALSRAMGNPWSLAFSLNFLSRVAYAQGAYAEAQQLLQEGLALSQTLSDRFNIATAQSGLGQVHQALGQGNEAQHFFQASIAIWREIGDQGSLAQTLNQLGETLLMLGDRPTAHDCFEEALAVAREAQIAPTMLDSLLGIASLHANEGALEAALELLLHILQNPASTQEARSRAEQLHAALAPQLPIQKLEIIHKRASGQSLGALAASDGDLRRVVGEESKAAALSPGRTEYMLLATFPSPQTEAHDSIQAAHTPQTATLVETLSARESEILHLIANGHSNQAIADRLIIAVSTVKKHINNIYGKLDVQSRTQALLRARELKLL